MSDSATSDSMPVPHITINEVRVSCLPDGPDTASLGDGLSLYVKFRARGENGERLYGIYGDDERLCYNNSTGKWDYESFPSGRPENWKDDHRFPYSDAVEMASLMAPHLSYNFLTVPVALKALSIEDVNERFEYLDDISAAYFAKHRAEHEARLAAEANSEG